MCQKNIAFTTENFFITENLTVHGEDGKKGKKSFLQNANINIARRAMSSAGWESSESPEPADEAKGEKPMLNAGSLALHGGVAHESFTGNSQKALFKKRSQLTNVNTTSFKGLRLFKSFVA